MRNGYDYVFNGKQKRQKRPNIMYKILLLGLLAKDTIKPLTINMYYDTATWKMEKMTKKDSAILKKHYKRFK